MTDIMPNELTNLLPPERQRVFRRDYFLRLSVVTLFLFTVLIFVAAILLLPTYVFLTKSGYAKEVRLASIEKTFSSSEEEELSVQLASLSRDVATLTALVNTPSISKILLEVLAVPRPGISLNNFVYTAATGKNPGTISIYGTAVTRDVLRNYQTALTSATFVSAADLPVSAYAKDADIEFTIDVTLAP